MGGREGGRERQRERGRGREGRKEGEFAYMHASVCGVCSPA
jgi:hypothetical protein